MKLKDDIAIVKTDLDTEEQRRREELSR